MTQPTTVASRARLVACALLGLALAAYGVSHGVETYPGPDVVARLADAMPSIRAAGSFALGVAAALAGLALLVPAAIHLRRRPRQPRPAFAPPPRGPFSDRPATAPRPLPPRRDEGYDPEFDGYDGGDDYRGGYGGSGYAGNGYGDRPRPDNGEFDERQWPAGSYR